MQTRTTIPFNKLCAPLSGPVLWGLLTAASLAFSPLAQAVGLGNYQVRSALGQPLKISVDIISSTKGAVSPSCFSVGRESSSNPDSIPFVTQGNVAIEGKGKSAHLVFTAARATNDPVVKLAIETACGQRSRREFTIMLDPQQSTDGKEIPLPLAPNTPAADSATAVTAPAATPPTMRFTPVQTPPAKSTLTAHPAPTKPSSTESTFTNLPGSLTSTELDNLEKAIQKGKSSNKNAQGLKKPKAKNDVSDDDSGGEKKKSSDALSPSSNNNKKSLRRVQGNEDTGNVRLSISDGEQGTITQDHIQPKLSMITELAPLENPSGGSADMGAHALSAEERAAILAKVERVVNAPLEHDLPKENTLPSSGSAKTEDANDSPYERYIKQRTTEALDKKLAAQSSSASPKKNYRLVAALSGAALLLAFFWWRRRNVARYKGYGADLDQKKKRLENLKETLNPSSHDEDLVSSTSWSEGKPVTTTAYPGTQTHTVTFEYGPDAEIPENSEHGHDEIVTHTHHSDSHTFDKPHASDAPTFVSAFSSAEEAPVSLTKSSKPASIVPHDSTEIHTHLPDAEMPTSKLSDPFGKPLHTQLEFPVTLVASPLHLVTSPLNTAPEESPSSLSDKTAFPTLQPASSHLGSDPLLMSTPEPSTQNEFNANLNRLESASHLIDGHNSPNIDQAEHPLPQPATGNESILVQGQTVVDQATQYLYAEQNSVAQSYLESSIEWLTAAPQPWLMLLRLHATRQDDESLFDTLQKRFLDFFRGIESFSRDDLLRQPEISQHDHHHSALEHCAPELLNQIMNDWNDNEKVKQQLENVLTQDLQSSGKRFTIEAVQELLFLYNLISIKNTHK